MNRVPTLGFSRSWTFFSHLLLEARWLSPRAETEAMFHNKSFRMHRLKSKRSFQLERNTLRLLCSAFIRPGTRVGICQLLHPGVFQNPFERVVFEEIRDVGAIESQRLREILPARVTNRGFPDFDLHDLLAPQQSSEKDIDKIFESALQLLDLSHSDEEQPVE
jgi:hypothetical protein